MRDVRRAVTAKLIKLQMRKYQQNASGAWWCASGLNGANKRLWAEQPGIPL